MVRKLLDEGVNTIGAFMEVNLPLLVVGPFDEDQSTWLRVSGLHVQRVQSCREAQRFLRRHRVPLVICKRDLPDGSWRNVLGSLTALTDPPFLIVTSRLADEDLWLEVLDAGGYDVMTEPWDELETRRTIAQARYQWSAGRATTAELAQSPGERSIPTCLTLWLRPVVVFVASLFAFGALYAGIMLLE